MDIPAHLLSDAAACLAKDAIVLALMLAVLSLLWSRFLASTYYRQYNIINGVRNGTIFLTVVLALRALYLSDHTDLPARDVGGQIAISIPLCGSLTLNVAIVIVEAAVFFLAWRHLKPLSWLETRLWWENPRNTQARTLRQLTRFVRRGDDRAIKAVIGFAEGPLALTQFPELREPLTQIGSNDVCTLLSKKLKYGGSDDAESERAIEILEQIARPQSVDVLMHALAQMRPGKTRLKVVKALARLRDARAIDPLLNIASDSGVELVEEAWGALDALGASPDQRFLYCQQAIKNSDSRVRELVLTWLRDMHESRTIPTVTQLFSDRNEAVAKGTFQAFEVLAADEGQRLQAYRLAAQNCNANVRERAVLELASLKSDAAIESLVALCSDHSGAVCDAALTALEQAGAQRVQLVQAYEQASKNPDVRNRQRVATELDGAGEPEAISTLLRLCKDESSVVFDAAVKSLTSAGTTPQDVLNVLDQRLADLDAALEEVRKEAEGERDYLANFSWAPFHDMTDRDSSETNSRLYDRTEENLERLREREAELATMRENVCRRRAILEYGWPAPGATAV